MSQVAYVIGSPISHSISPAIHNAAFAALALDARYLAADVPADRLAAWVQEARSRPDVLGFNVTLPHKEAIVPLLDRVEGDARLIGAVNTVIVSGGRADGSPRALIGVNTDTVGFRQSLAQELGASLEGQRVLLLGAGGAARAVALVALQDGAAELWVANRHRDRAQLLLAELAPLGPATRCRALALDDPELTDLLPRASVVINATSVGLRSTALPLEPRGLQPSALAVDVVYTPVQTAFLQAAQRQGVRVLGGLSMLVHQAAAAFQRWTGCTAPIAVMRQAAEAALPSP